MGGQQLNEQTCPILRDTFEDYKPLERMFGILSTGMAFGESALLNYDSKPTLRFYNAIAMTESYVLIIMKKDFVEVVTN